MKIVPPPQNAAVVTLQTVLDRLSANARLAGSRKRDLRSAVTSFAKLMDQPPGAIPMELAAIRQSLDRMVPARAKISPKRWSNLRADLAAAIAASGLRPMLRMADVALAPAWSQLLAAAPQWTRHGLSRLARWCSLRQIGPEAIDDGVIERFIAELDSSTLVRNLRYRSGLVRRAWNALVAQHPTRLRPVTAKPNQRALKRIPWDQFPASLRQDVERYLYWAAVPDPLDDAARARALSQQTLQLQRQHIHSAASAAVEAGIVIEQLTSLASLVETEFIPRHSAPSPQTGWRQAHRLHPRRRHNADCHCLGMGEGISANRGWPEGLAEQTWSSAIRLDGEKQGTAADPR